jgi:RHS repeat-associated protein
LSFEEYGAYGNTTISATGNTAVSYLKPESGLDQSNGVGSDIAVDLSLLLKIHRYSGKERDVATGLYYYGMRYYSTSTCRWLSADPAGPVDGLNLYQFVGSNPINFTDPDGRMMVRKRDLRNQSKKVTNNNKGNNNKTDLTMNNQNKVKNDLDFITPSQKISNNKEEIDTINTNIKSLNAENQSLKENMMAYQNSYNQGKITILLREFKLEEYKNRVRQFSENEKKINNYSKRKDTLARENNQAWKEINKLHNDQAKRLMDEKLQDESRNTKLTSLPSMINIISTVGNALGAIIEPNSGIIISVFAFLISFTVATIDFSEKKKYYNKKQNLQIAVSKVGVLGSHIAIALAGGDKNLISDVNDQKSLIQEEDIKYGMVALGLFLLILGMSVEHKIKKT